MNTYILLLIVFFVNPVYLSQENKRDNNLFWGISLGLTGGIALNELIKYINKRKENEQTRASTTANSTLIPNRYSLPEAHFSTIELEKVFVDEKIKTELLVHAKRIFSSTENKNDDLKKIQENMIALYGPSGTLKTTLIQGIAHELNIPLLLIDEKFLTNQAYEALSLELIFQQIQKVGPCIVHIKNIHNLHKNFFISFIKCLEGFHSSFPVLLTFSTNNDHVANELKINKKKYVAFYILEKPKQAIRKKIIVEMINQYSKYIDFDDMNIDELAFLFDNCSQLDIFLIFAKTVHNAKINSSITYTDNKKLFIRKREISHEFKKYKKAEIMVQTATAQKNNFSKIEEFLIDESQITFDQVIGSAHIKDEIKRIVEFFANSKKFKDANIRLPKGYLFIGPPGCGKTMMAKAIAHEAGVSMFVINASEVIHKYVGEGAATIKKIFEFARAHTPCIIFIDEIDAIASHRTDHGDGEREKDRTLNQLLTEIDGFRNAEAEIIVIGATNRPKIIDEALIRSGRLEKHLSFSLPTLKEREQIIRQYLGTMPIENEFSLQKLASQTAGFSGADLEFLMNNAKIISFCRTDNNRKLTEADIHQAYTDFTIGLELKNITVEETQIKKTAYHEIGHTLTMLLQENFPYEFDTVTIIPRDRGGGSVVLGFARYFTKVDLQSFSKSELKKLIISILGGLVAESIIYKDDIDNGASSDLEKASHIAKTMVKNFGMAETLFSGEEKITEKEQEIIENILQECKNECKALLEANITLLETLADKLVEKKTLSKEEIVAFINANQDVHAK